MSERKVLNKYYPPDFNPSILPKLKLDRFRQYQIRTMAPFNMRCKTCGEFIYKGKKFNSRKETVKGENYLGLEIYRFYIRCTRCLAEITYKTDPVNTDYAIEHGATRNFEAETTARKMEDAKVIRQEEEMQNPMKILENRTKDSQREMELLETLEELKELNARQSMVDFDALLKQHSDVTKHIEAKIYKGAHSGLTPQQEDELLLREILAEKKARNIRRLEEGDEDDDSQYGTPSSSSTLPPQYAKIISDNIALRETDMESERLTADQQTLPDPKCLVQNRPNSDLTPHNNDSDFLVPATPSTLPLSKPNALSRKTFLSGLVVSQKKKDFLVKNSAATLTSVTQNTISSLVTYGGSDKSSSGDSD